MTIAKRIHAANREAIRVEHLICDTLRAVGAETFSTDWHDNSIEVFGHGVKRDAAALEALREAGFSLAWLHAPECEPPRGNDCGCKPVRLHAAGKP